MIMIYSWAQMLSTLETIVSLLNTLILSCLEALRRRDCYHVPYFWVNLWIIYYSFVTKQHSCSIDCMAIVLYFEAESLSFLCDSGYLWLTWRSFSATSASPFLPSSLLPDQCYGRHVTCHTTDVCHVLTGRSWGTNWGGRAGNHT